MLKGDFRRAEDLLQLLAITWEASPGVALVAGFVEEARDVLGLDTRAAPALPGMDGVQRLPHQFTPPPRRSVLSVDLGQVGYGLEDLKDELVVACAGGNPPAN